MNGKEQLQQAEKKLFCSAPRFAQFIRNGEFDKASAIMGGVASAFAVLAFTKEAKYSDIVAELNGVLNLIDDAWNAANHGIEKTALMAYAEVVKIMPDTHHRVEALLLSVQADSDPGTRGNDKTYLVDAAQQSLSSLGLA